MRKIVKIILCSLLTLNLTFTSFASDDQPVKEGTDQKAGEKIIITESVTPVTKPAENPNDNDKKDETKPNEDKPEANKKEDSAYKDSKEKLGENKESTNEHSQKSQDSDMDRIDKVVDELVQKLDKNSNLSKALSEMQTSKNTDKKATIKSKEDRKSVV